MAGRFENIRKKVDADNVDVEPHKKSEWNHQCDALNCPLKPSVIRGGAHLCTFHNGASPGEGFRDWNAISYAINQDINLIKKIKSLTFKGSDFWNDKLQQRALMGWDFCPMIEGEFIDNYLRKLNRKLERVIKDNASEAIEKGYV